MIYLAALAVLVINDHVLKVLMPGAITGKLSDFAGLFALAVFLGALMPRRIAAIAAGAFFVYWKSPLSQPLIDALPWDAVRVVDWTDLAALAVLPFAERVRIERMRASIAALSLFAFAATSVPHQNIQTVPDPAPRFETQTTFDETVKRLKRCGLHPYVYREADPPHIILSYRSRLGHDVHVTLAPVGTDDGAVVLEYRWMDVFHSGPPVEEQPYLDDMEEKVRACVGVSSRS